MANLLSFIYFVAFATGLIGMGFSVFSFVYQVDNAHCFDSTVHSRPLAFLFNIMSFILFYSWIAGVREQDRTKKTTIFDTQSKYILGCVFVLLNMGSTGLNTDIFRQCAEIRNGTEAEQLKEVYLREVIQTTSTYFLNCAIVLVSPMNFEMHLDLFYWMGFMVTVELCQVWANGGVVPAPFVFSYFNIKLALLVFDAGMNCDYTHLFRDDDVKQSGARDATWRHFNMLLFIAYMASHILMHIYYNQPSNDRWNKVPKGHEVEWGDAFWVAAAVETVSLSILLVQAILLNIETKDGTKEDRKPLKP
eukprot:m.280678 g.280678  ORF g.280678 m.280678 type:complete len:305 (-) comp16325_c0_seq42:150-1064(-)